ncbi:MAG: hypothetical protein ACO1RT_15200 [Planctomycetaceae bacterium]
MQHVSKRNRRGVTFAELTVASALLIGGMSLVGRLVVTNGRLLQQSRHNRLALDELTNQLEWLTTLEGEALTAAIEDLEPSATIVDALPGPTLNAERVDDDEGSRLTLSIRWETPQPSAPIKLTAWLRPVSQSLADTLESEVAP